MKNVRRKIISSLLLIPLFSVITFCCCLEEDAFAENATTEHHQKLEKSSHHSEHQDSQNQDECTCPKHLSFLSEQSFDLIPNLSSPQLLAKNLLAVPAFQAVLLSSSSLHSQGPPGQDHRDQVTTPIFLKNSNLRI